MSNISLLSVCMATDLKDKQFYITQCLTMLISLIKDMIMRSGQYIVT